MRAAARKISSFDSIPLITCLVLRQAQGFGSSLRIEDSPSLVSTA
jgi:hypothetical protein